MLGHRATQGSAQCQWQGVDICLGREPCRNLLEERSDTGNTEYDVRDNTIPGCFLSAMVTCYDIKLSSGYKCVILSSMRLYVIARARL